MTTFAANAHLDNFFRVKLYSGKLKAFPFPIMNCYACPASMGACPIGTLSHFIAMGRFPALTLGILMAPSAIFGRAICGWVCPFGFFQDMLYKIPTGFKLKIPSSFDKLKFVFLFFFVGVLTFITKKHFFCLVCPVGTLEGGIFWVSAVPSLRMFIDWLFLLKLFIAFSIVIGATFIKRPFCRFMCPLGAFFSLFNKVSLMEITYDEGKCRRCNRCQEVCPVDYKIYLDPNSTSCIRCLDCVRQCDALDWRFAIGSDKEKGSEKLT